MSTLTRLKVETERLKEQKARKVFVSSNPVQAFRVANNRKELLSRGAPLILALPQDATAGIGSLLIDASVGSDLRWTLTSINHVLRTVSKWGEPTYLFANILDNDPKAFVAVTLDKHTRADEVSHLESVLGRVSQFHVAEKRLAQLPDADQVLSSLGKGLKALMGLGGSSSSSSKQKERSQAEQQEQQAEQAAYLASRAGAGGAPTTYQASGDYHQPSPANLRQEPAQQGGWGCRAAAAGSPSTTAMGVKDRADADDRLARLKAELGREGQPPSAPDVHATPTETARYKQQQEQQRQAYAYGSGGSGSDSDSEWVIYQPASRYSTHEADWPGAGSARGPGNVYTAADAPAGPERAAGTSRTATAGSYYPPVPGAYGAAHTTGGQQAAPPTGGGGSSDWWSGRDQQKQQQQQQGPVFKGYEGAGGLYQGSVGYDTSTAAAGSAPGSRATTSGAVKPAWGQSGGVAAATASELQQEAEQARLEWEQAQHDADAAAQRARRDQEMRDAGWGQQGKVMTARQQQQQQQARRGEERQQPDWIDLLGKVFGGGPAYSYAAPDL